MYELWNPLVLPFLTLEPLALTVSGTLALMCPGHINFNPNCLSSLLQGAPSDPRLLRWRGWSLSGLHELMLRLESKRLANNGTFLQPFNSLVYVVSAAVSDSRVVS